jgi:hypothetical protein
MEPQWLTEPLFHRSDGKNLPRGMVNNSLLPGFPALLKTIKPLI